MKVTTQKKRILACSADWAREGVQVGALDGGRYRFGWCQIEVVEGVRFLLFHWLTPWATQNLLFKPQTNTFFIYSFLKFTPQMKRTLSYSAFGGGEAHKSNSSKEYVYLLSIDRPRRPLKNYFSLLQTNIFFLIHEIHAKLKKSSIIRLYPFHLRSAHI